MSPCPRGCCRSARDHFRSIRTIGEGTRHENRRERTLSKDLAAYRSLTEDGLEPKRIDGCAELVGRDAPRHVIEGNLPVEVDTC